MRSAFFYMLVLVCTTTTATFAQESKPLVTFHPVDECYCSFPVYGGAEFMYLATSAQDLPASDIAPEFNPPRILQGGDYFLDNNERLAASATLGIWLDPAHTIGLEAKYLHVFERSTSTPVDSTLQRLMSDVQSSIFMQVGTGDPGNTMIPPLEPVTGQNRIHWSSRFWAAEANVRKNLIRSAKANLDVIGGFRYYNLEEGMTISDVTQTGNFLGPLNDSTIATTDLFAAENDVFAGQIGVESQLRFGPLTLEIWGKLGLGGNRQAVEIQGNTNLNSPALGVQNFQGGLLARPTNSGLFTRDRFVVIPEAGAKVGLYVTENLRTSIGYTMLYFSKMVRPAAQIDPVLSHKEIPIFLSPLQRRAPHFRFRDSEFWLQGLTAEIEFRF